MGYKHPKLCAPVSQVIDPQHIMPHPLQQATNALPNDGWPKIQNMIAIIMTTQKMNML